MHLLRVIPHRYRAGYQHEPCLFMRPCMHSDFLPVINVLIFGTVMRYHGDVVACKNRISPGANIWYVIMDIFIPLFY